METNTTFIIPTSKGTYKFKVSIEETNHNKLIIRFPYNKNLIEEIKSMEGARWHPELKYWTITNSQHNQFQLDYLQGKNPYEQYDKELDPYVSSRKLYNFQIEGIQFILKRRQCLLTYDMGLGKSLIAIEVLEYLQAVGFTKNSEDIIWVGPNSALISVQYEFWKWKFNGIKPQFHTYDSLKKFCKALESGLVKTPRIVIFDEIQKLKNPTTQRTQAAQYLTDKIRYTYGSDGYIIGMSGTPAPHSPLDWWSICRVIRPGFLKEGTLPKFQRRIGLVKTEENNVTGGMYPKLVTWFDNPAKCKICGKLKEDFNHDSFSGLFGNDAHPFQPSINEIETLYKRMKGLVLVKFKKDVLSELPDKIFRKIECEVSESTRRMANMILKTSTRTIEALTLLRELSDGFQYKEEVIPNKQVTCELCKGIGTISVPNENTICPNCNASGKQQATNRTVIEIPTPKDQVLIDLLEEYEDVGRIVVGAAFTGTIDKIVRLIRKQGWNHIRVDGRGWDSSVTDFKSNTNEMLKIFQDYKDLYPKVAFIANPGSGGTGLNLTASPVIVNYSNTFKGEDRMQFIERIHRLGTDINKGATVIDIIHLETDSLVLENLEKKIDLLKITLGDVETTLKQVRNQSGIRYI